MHISICAVPPLPLPSLTDAPDSATTASCSARPLPLPPWLHSAHLRRTCWGGSRARQRRGRSEPRRAQAGRQAGAGVGGGLLAVPYLHSLFCPVRPQGSAVPPQAPKPQPQPQRAMQPPPPHAQCAAAPPAPPPPVAAAYLLLSGEERALLHAKRDAAAALVRRRPVKVDNLVQRPLEEGAGHHQVQQAVLQEVLGGLRGGGPQGPCGSAHTARQVPKWQRQRLTACRLTAHLAGWLAGRVQQQQPQWRCTAHPLIARTRSNDPSPTRPRTSHQYISAAAIDTAAPGLPACLLLSHICGSSTPQLTRASQRDTPTWRWWWWWRRHGPGNACGP